jgi:hypothetical protein
MYTHAQNGFTDSPKQTECTLFHERRWDAIPRGIFSIAAHHLKFLYALHKKVEVMCITPQQIHHFPGSPVPEVKRSFGPAGSHPVPTSRFRVQLDAG